MAVRRPPADDFGAAQPKPVPAAPVTSRLRLLREIKKQRPDGRVERFVEVACTCGRPPYAIQLSRWKRERPACCKVCRVAEDQRTRMPRLFGRIGARRHAR